jgi:glucose/arabinose dehydrogenase
MSKRKVQNQPNFVHLILYSNTQSNMKKTYFILAISLLSFSIFAQPTITVKEVITGLSQPMQLVNAGDGTKRIFIPQKTGEIKVFNENFTSLGTFLTVTGIPTGGEQGLLSLCFHPQYQTNGFFFVFYTNNIGSLEIARYRVGSGIDSVNLARPSSKKVVITIPHPNYSNHNGGTLRFGRDGFLYLSTGDGGGGGDPDNNAQNKNNLLGKMLRINVNASNTAPYYTIPSSNPILIGNTVANEILAYGLRNPFRWNFDRLTGDMWIGDVGQNAFEEFNRCHRDSLAGVNYGWRCYEGNNPYNTTGCNDNNYKFPFLTYPTLGSSAVGGTVYRGQAFPSMEGYYLCADFYSGQLFKVKYNSVSNTYQTSTQNIPVNGITDFGETEDGEMYITSLFTGKVFRIESPDPAIYTFTGNGNWTNPANWSNNTVPPTTSPFNILIAIKPVAGGECIVNTPITIPVSSKVLIDNNEKLRMSSNLSFQ